MNPLLALLPLALLADKAVPEAKDVKAGWLAFGVFLLLIGATVVLCFSFVKQLRKAQAARDAGVYGDPPAAAESPDAADQSREHPAQP